MKYKLEMYGWSVEAMGFSLSDGQVKSIKDLMESNGYSELWEARNDLEDEGIIDDIYSPDLFHKSCGLSNDALTFVVSDENNKEVLKFTAKDMGDFEEVFGDGADDIPYEGYLAIPGRGDISEVDNILATFDEGKGGIAGFETFESGVAPTPIDFCYQKGYIVTPDGDWEFVSKLYFKDKELELGEYLDYNGKASTVEIYRKGGTIIK
ncbi:MAG: hypothetical protein CMC48_08705 [Flavobacteriaceae bacterium]|nr:hypothetical protein [Flavobacteriaceae bacterium]|tara:strand:+ start:1337 stop:1960 length:624 start_codon:yes stop_codon:yes gene_type:complete